MDATSVSSGRGDAVRVLLAGSGVTSGWGVHTHGLALVGALQQVLQTSLGRPVDVEQVSALGATLADAPGLLKDRATEEWDAIVVAFGLSDAMRLTPIVDWAQALGRLLAKLDADMPQGLVVPILVVGVPPMGSLGALRLLMPLRSFIGRHGERLNSVTRAEVARDRRAVFVPLPGMANSARRPVGSPEAYQAWAEVIADRLVRLLPVEVERVDLEGMPLHRVDDLVAGVLAPQNADVRTRLQEIAARAASRFGADLAVVHMVNGDRMWNVTDSGGASLKSVARSETLCHTTLLDGFLHVPDVAGDPRFAGLALAAKRGIGSYAGVAIRTEGGAAVATLCLYSGGTSSAIDDAALRRFGAAAEAELALLCVPDPEARRLARAPSAIMAPDAGDRWDAVPDPEPVVADPSAEEAVPASPADRGTATWVKGRLDRQIRLRTEGRQLTRSAAVRSVPPETDTRVLGADPIRVLLVGGDYSVGFGARHRSEALDGALARLLHIRTGRGVIVENRSQHLVRLHQLSASLGPAGAHTFDLVVWTPTFVEAAGMLLPSKWVGGIESMLRKIEATSDASVVLVGIPSLLGSQPLAIIGRTRALQINRLLERVAARHPRVLVAVPPAIVLSEVDAADGPKEYRAAAVRILPLAMELLHAGSPSGAHGPSAFSAAEPVRSELATV